MSKKPPYSQDPQSISDSIKLILELLENKEFIEGPGIYIQQNDSFIAPKHQHLVYSLTDKIHADSIISEQISYINEHGKNIVPPSIDGIFFVVPLSSVVALPPKYHSNKIIVDRGNQLEHARSITLVNGVQNAGEDSEGNTILSGICFAILGYRSAHLDTEDIHTIYMQCVDYLNDFISAYKLFRHDHTVHNVTVRTLPSPIEYYTYANEKLSEKDLLFTHANDIMDLWAKRLPHPDELERFKVLTESLPTQKTVHYILKLGEESIGNLCMAQYEDAIINSDRFVELVLRDVLRQELDLTPEQLSKYRELYSTRRPDFAVVQVLANRLGFRGDAIVSKWYKNSRIVRNNITHKLDFESIDSNRAMQAVDCNMRLINFVISLSDKDLGWYQLIPDTYAALFLNGKGL